jgi:hypothetical protein
LTTAFFVTGNGRSGAGEMVHGTHKALVALGVLTIVSTVVFRSLKRGDGDTVSNQKIFHPGG